MRPKQARFWPKNRAILQKNRGPTEIIFHFFLRFSCFGGLIPLQPVAFQRPAAIKTLPKKSYQKHYRRFFVPSGMCLNGLVKVGTTDRNQGCHGWTAAICRPALRAKRFELRNGSSAFGQPAAKQRCRADTQKRAGLSGAHQTPSNLIKANQTQSHLLDEAMPAIPLLKTRWFGGKSGVWPAFAGQNLGGVAVKPRSCQTDPNWGPFHSR
jgi:hypothetical protein